MVAVLLYSVKNFEPASRDPALPNGEKLGPVFLARVHFPLQ